MNSPQTFDLDENFDNLNLGRICRACLEEHEDMRPLYSSHLDNVLRSVARIDVQAGDGLPESICLQCVSDLNRAIRFKQQCERSDHSLRRYLAHGICDNNRTASSSVSRNRSTTSGTRDLEVNLDNLNLELICRACVEEHGGMRPLYGTRLDNMLRSVAMIDVQVGDGLPESICLRCVLQLSRAFRLQQKCERSDITLRSYLSQSIDEKPTDKSYITSGIKKYCKRNNQVGKERVLNLKNSKTKQDVVICPTGDSYQSGFKNFLEAQILEDSAEISSSTHIEIPPTFKKPSRKGRAVKTKNIETETPEHGSNSKKDVNSVNTSIKCEICSKLFPNRVTWKRHVQTHDPIRLHVCKKCGMSFTLTTHLRKHMEDHSGELNKVRTCPICGKSFNSAKSLTNHKYYHSVKDVLKCPHCPKHFGSNSGLRIHLRNHTGERPYVCDVCKKGFISKYNLADHSRIHTGERPYLCSTCGKRFPTNSEYCAHLRIHTTPCTCPDCGKKFARKYLMTYHQRVHTGEKPHVCSVCDAKFARSESLIIHKRKHTGERPFACTICPDKFTNHSSLKKHLKSHERKRNLEADKSDSKFNVKRKARKAKCNSVENAPQN